MQEKDYDIVLTGAGTSEFVGNALRPALSGLTNYKIHSYATTDIVVNPTQYLSSDKPTLLVSFAHSGNSPESWGAIEVADQVCTNIRHLIVTCNKDGVIAKRAEGHDHCCLLLLPEETEDKGFAMTSSFTSMYVVALVLFQLGEMERYKHMIGEMRNCVTNLLTQDWRLLKGIVDDYDFDRIVYLGSGVLKGIAQESALKMLELNAGKVATFFDSPLGFRHGPKSIINHKTLTVVYMNDDEYARQYDMDLVRELSVQRNGNKLMAIGNRRDEALERLVDYSYLFGCEQTNLPADVISLGCIVAAQSLALLKSLKNGIAPDTPCESGTVSRVVKGVTIYPYRGGEN